MKLLDTVALGGWYLLGILSGWIPIFDGQEGILTLQLVGSPPSSLVANRPPTLNYNDRSSFDEQNSNHRFVDPSWIFHVQITRCDYFIASQFYTSPSSPMNKSQQHLGRSVEKPRRLGSRKDSIHPGRGEFCFGVTQPLVIVSPQKKTSGKKKTNILSSDCLVGILIMVYNNHLITGVVLFPYIPLTTHLF